jgi:8-oxo-dGTP pyrophosphatase MutT (NUDIX family)
MQRNDGRKTAIPTRTQVSAGGVAFRKHGPVPEVVVISVGPQRRLQLPKGTVEEGELPEAAALREIREEAGIHTRLIAPIESIEYWYIGGTKEERVRFHKFVHFFLVSYVSGDVRDHDHEVVDAMWLRIDQAGKLLSFKNERDIVERAREMIDALA